MKLIKLIMAVTMTFGMVVAQDLAANSNCEALCWDVPVYLVDGDPMQAYGQNQDGSDACPNLDCAQVRPHPAVAGFMGTLNEEETNANEAFDAAAAVFYDMMVTPGYMTEDEYDTGKADAKAAFDAALNDGRSPEEALGAAMDAGRDGDGECGYEGCEFVGNSEEDWHEHCEDNPDHCKPRAGDICECDFVFAGTEADEDHRHCPTCKAQFTGDDEMREHCEDEGHCGDGDGPHTCQFTDENGNVCGHEFAGEEDEHCEENPDHCRPRAGDTCECGFTFAGTDADENHRHCPTCNAQFDNDGDMGQHCQDNEGHCGDNNDQN